MRRFGGEDRWQERRKSEIPEVRDGILVYKVTVVGRDLTAINYFHRSGSTKVGFQGTNLLPQAKGSAKVDSKQGRTSIDIDIQGLSPANGFGPEYLTYVLWAITPEGRPVNLGEVLPGGSKEGIHMTVTTNLQTFGMIVTAEPYFAVTMPSDIVVMQNVVIDDKTEGVIEQVNAHYSLLPRGAYADTAGRHTVLRPITRDERSPLELYEAENAVQIAEAAGAGKYASDTLATATVALKNAKDLDMHKEQPQGDHNICPGSCAVGRGRAHHHHSQDQGGRRRSATESEAGCRAKRGAGYSGSGAGNGGGATVATECGAVATERGAGGRKARPSRSGRSKGQRCGAGCGSQLTAGQPAG
jgi:hypothetical protein